MRPLLDFDDAGAQDDEPAKGVTVGDIRAWHNDRELHSAHYDRILASWAECRSLLSNERRETALLRAERDAADEVSRTAKAYALAMEERLRAIATIPVANNDWVRLVDQNGTEVVGAGPACAACKQTPRADCPNRYCAFRAPWICTDVS